VPRKTTIVVIDTPGRDQGKIYHLNEMSSGQAEAWAMRLLLAVANSGVDIPEGVFYMGMAALPIIGLKAITGLRWEIAQPLMAEMMNCVSIQPSRERPQITRPLIEDDIEEVYTRLQLRDALIELHTGFSVAGYISDLKKRPVQPAPPPLNEDGSDTGTSPQLSQESLAADLPLFTN
jgi:hypothetical protein